MGTLYVVATPIGNLEDMTARAIRVLGEVSLIAAEDTRQTRKLLTHFGIKTPLVSYHAFNERSRRDRLLAALASGDVAVVSDAGSPGIADPGRDLVAAAAAAGFPVAPVPGPSSLVAAVGVSGLIDGPFAAIGFLPRKGAERRAVLGRAAAVGYALVLFEAPGRLAATLRDLFDALGDRPAIVGRELTKVHEEIVRGPLSELVDRFEANAARGEIVIVVAADVANTAIDDPTLVVQRLLRYGLRPSEVAREAAAITGLPRSDLYEIARRLRSDDSRPGEP